MNNTVREFTMPKDLRNFQRRKHFPSEHKKDGQGTVNKIFSETPVDSKKEDYPTPSNSEQPNPLKGIILK